MIYTIKKGNHYPTPIQLQKVYFNPKKLKLSYHVEFQTNCRYSLPLDDMGDINKLFGISFGYHHTNSERFGWRYDEHFDKIELLEYRYINGKRSSYPLCYLFFNRINFLEMEIEQINNHLEITYRVNGKTEHKFVRPKPKALISYTLGLYFGGNQTAPRNMSILIQ